jgi:hypothetical protein
MSRYPGRFRSVRPHTASLRDLAFRASHAFGSKEIPAGGVTSGSVWGSATHGGFDDALAIQNRLVRIHRGTK